MKKILYVSFTCLLISSIDAAGYRKDPECKNLYYRDGMTYHDARQPKENTLIAWDLNGVIFDKAFSSLPTIFNEIRSKKGWGYAFRLARAARTLNSERSIINSDGKKEKLCWDAVLTQHEVATDPLSQYVEDMRMATTRVNKLNLGMAHLITTLHDAGHHNHILSNMGQNVLNVIIEHMKKHQADYNMSKSEFSYFMQFLKDKNHSFISSAKNNWVTKPNPEAYKKFLSKNKVLGKKIFIDDKRANCIAAIEKGNFDFAIQFKGEANLEHILFDILNIKR